MQSRFLHFVQQSRALGGAAQKLAGSRAVRPAVTLRPLPPPPRQPPTYCEGLVVGALLGIGTTSCVSLGVDAWARANPRPAVDPGASLRAEAAIKSPNDL